MSEFYPIIFGLAFMSILGAAVALFLRAFNPDWWKHRQIKLMVLIVPVVGGVAIGAWALGVAYAIRWITFAGAATTALTAIILIALLLSLPISGIIHAFGWLIKKFPRKPQTEPSAKFDHRRRLFLKSAAAVFPAATVLAGADGFIESFSTANIRRMTFVYPDLPPALEGLKIFQISDCHLGFYVGLSDLKQVISEAQAYKPDLVLLTGDISDNLDILPDALVLAEALAPRYGVFASLGNHEYYRGVGRVKTIYAKSPIPLLINDGRTIDIDGTQLYIGGADDPRQLRRDNSEFLEKTVSKAMAAAPPSSFKILMSHRPEGFQFAAERGVQLTLSGHTHGGQLGFAGHAVFESLLSYKYLWGHYYLDNQCQLYTTAGIGHWFPFRLGCHTEAPLITLSSKA
jgi:uncharacterized protein